MKKPVDISRLKTVCPMPELLRTMGLGRYAKRSCPSPFRSDHNPSWGIFQISDRWMYKDFATGESGDEIGVLAKINQLDPQRDFQKLLSIYEKVASNKLTSTQIAPAVQSRKPAEKPDLNGFDDGTYEQIEKLSALRGISVEGLQFALDREVLMFGWCCGHEVYGVKDSSNRLVEVRRLDGGQFPAWGHVGERKSHTLKGSQKNWPLGILEAKDLPCIALAEGLPDFLALHQYIIDEDAINRVGAVAMLSSACLICDEALPYFKGKHVRIYPHVDDPGIKAAQKWQKQLIGGGVAKVEFFDFSAFDNRQVKDLCDFNLKNVSGSDFSDRRILP